MIITVVDNDDGFLLLVCGGALLWSYRGSSIR